MSFQEIILLLTFIGSCIYATVSLTLKVLEFLLKNKRAADLDRSQRQMKALHKAAIIMKIALRFRKAIFGAPSGTRTQDPLIKSQLLSQMTQTKPILKSVQTSFIALSSLFHVKLDLLLFEFAFFKQPDTTPKSNTIH